MWSSKSTPLSNLFEASVDKPKPLEDLLIHIGSKYAHSIKIFFVELVTSVSLPPITPAIAIGISESQIKRFLLFNILFLPSSVKNFSLDLALRILMFLVFNLSKSKIWIGWPNSNKIKLDISTIEFIDWIPFFFNLSFNQIGDFETLISLTITAEYLGQSSKELEVIVNFFDLFLLRFLDILGSFIFLLVKIDASLATPK